MTRYKSFSGIGSGPMTTSPIPHQRAIRQSSRAFQGMLDQPHHSPHPQPPPQQIRSVGGGGMGRTPVGVEYSAGGAISEPYGGMPVPRQQYPSPPIAPRGQYPTEYSGGNPYGGHPSIPQMMGGAVERFAQGVANQLPAGFGEQLPSYPQQYGMGDYPQPIGPQSQNCRLIATHIKNCPYCCKIYKRDSNLLITVIVILLLLIVVLLTKLADK